MGTLTVPQKKHELIKPTSKMILTGDDDPEKKPVRVLLGPPEIPFDLPGHEPRSPQ
jgi:hypothetical protein